MCVCVILGLKALTYVVQQDANLALPHQMTIIECLDHSDVIIKREVSEAGDTIVWRGFGIYCTHRWGCKILNVFPKVPRFSIDLS